MFLPSNNSIILHAAACRAKKQQSCESCPLLFGSMQVVLRLSTAYPDKIIINGLEQNVPGYEHCSTAIHQYDGKATAIGEFEYRFDRSDKNTSRDDAIGFEGAPGPRPQVTVVLVAAPLAAPAFLSPLLVVCRDGLSAEGRNFSILFPQMLCS